MYSELNRKINSYRNFTL